MQSYETPPTRTRFQSPRRYPRSSPPLLTLAELADEFYRAQRHGQVDRARRLASRLAARGCSIRPDNLATGGAP
jgi:hypothetical protein